MDFWDDIGWVLAGLNVCCMDYTISKQYLISHISISCKYFTTSNTPTNQVIFLRCITAFVRGGFMCGHIVQFVISGNVFFHELLALAARFLPQPMAQIAHDGQPHGVLVFQTDRQIPVPLVHVHEQHIASAHIDADAVLRKARLAAGVLAALNNHQVAEPLGIVTAVRVNGCLVIHVRGDGGERGVGNFEIRLLGLAVLPLVMIGHDFLVIRVNLSDERNQLLKFVGVQHVEARFAHGGVQFYAVLFQQHFLAGSERVKVADDVGHCGDVFILFVRIGVLFGPDTGREPAIRGLRARKINHVFVECVNFLFGQLALPKFEEETVVVRVNVGVVIDDDVNERGGHELVLVSLHAGITNIFLNVIHVNAALLFVFYNHCVL